MKDPPGPPASARRTELAAALLESDAAYFEAGARVTPLPGATLAWMEGLPALAAAGVVHRVAADLGGLAPDRWLDRAEQAIREVGRTGLRLYLQQPHAALEAVLRRRGYRSRTEHGMLRIRSPEPLGSRRPRVVLRAVEQDSDWTTKLALHEAGDSGPDGHRATAREWVAMERRKAEAGYFRPYLVLLDGDVCGAVAGAPLGALRRLKNLVLHPSWRGRGIGGEVVETLFRTLPPVETAMGCFALEAGEGESLYRRCGFARVTLQTEWIRGD